jgi:plasmid stabilization system protein ParE
MLSFRIHRLVEREFNEARAWYAERSPLAAEYFSAQFDRAMVRVQQRPSSHAPWRTIFRRPRLTSFTYLLLFHLEHGRVSVLSLVHDRREPARTLSTVRVRLETFL